MIGAGTFINPLLKIITTVAILGAAYLFIVKPALETTENISNRAFDTSDQIREDIQDSIDKSVPGGSGANTIDVKIPKSAERAQKLGACVTDATGDVDKINKCMDKFGS